MIYSRRAVQRRLNELRAVLGSAAVDSLCAKLNSVGPERLPAMWETVVLHGLSRIGHVDYEKPIASGRKPDVRFRGPVDFVADITTVSDEGLDKANPYQELSELVEKLKRKLGLPSGGVELRVLGREERSKRGVRTTLRIPDRGALQEFVRTRIEPEIKRQLADNRTVIELSLDDDHHGMNLRIDTAGGGYSGGSYPAYSSPTIVDRNPVFNALRDKARRQLRGTDGLTGIFICDGDCDALADKSVDWRAVSLREIIEEFLRQYSSIDFVYVFSFNLQPRGLSASEHIDPNFNGYFREDNEQLRTLGTVLHGMSAFFPKPLEMPVNARRHSHSVGYGWGHHGGYRLSNSTIRLSSREVMEILAGRRNVEELNQLGPGRSNPFERQLSRGRLPKKVTIHREPEDADDWIEIEFGDADPAISPFR